MPRVRLETLRSPSFFLSLATAVLVATGCAETKSSPAFVKPADDEAELQEAVSGLIPQLQACLANIQAVDASMVLSVEREGVVFPMVKASNTDDEGVHRCLYNTSRAWRIPRQAGSWARNVTFDVASPDHEPATTDIAVVPWNFFGWTHGKSTAELGNACMVCLGADGIITKTVVLETHPGLRMDSDDARRVYSHMHFKPSPSQPFCRTVGSALYHRGP
jgi:hypothetical protein